MDHDIIIAGGGPAGLGFARAMAGSGLSIAIVERQQREALAGPRYDGREIALTHRSIRTLADQGAWARIPADEISILKAAQVLNGASPLALTFDTGNRPEQALGMLVSNHLIRRALFECVEGQENLRLITGAEVAGAVAGPQGAEVRLSTGKALCARLLVAADSRFSSVRKQLGIDAEVTPVGKAMLVCRVEHELDHHHAATEWFDHGQTIAMLPLNGRASSAVVTLTLEEAKRLQALSSDALGAELTARYRCRLGSMRIASGVHVYPLTTTYADRFAIDGAALIGDAAVGMHPVTAHGFNLGILSANILAKEIIGARRRGEDWPSLTILRRYESRHRRESLPIYRATNMIHRLYSDERLPARLARHAAIRLGRRLSYARSAVTSMLMRG
jgi:ubiquinone biosynthesis UbiH/UbiF/VisC/COQ6 family hydroxylase